MMGDEILSFIHCATCVANGKRDRIVAGLTDPFTLRVWCKSCNRLVADFTLARPIMPRCDVCGEPISPGHSHH
jgi:hypothetical protein